MRGQGRGAALQLPQPTSLNLGILAYYVRKSEALVQIAVGGDASGRKGTGRAGFALWRSRVYLSAPSRSSTRATQPHPRGGRQGHAHGPSECSAET